MNIKERNVKRLVRNINELRRKLEDFENAHTIDRPVACKSAEREYWDNYADYKRYNAELEVWQRKEKD